MLLVSLEVTVILYTAVLNFRVCSYYYCYGFLMNDKKCLRLTNDALICTKVVKNELHFKYRFNILDFFSAMLNFQKPLHRLWCHIILQKPFQYADLVLMKHLLVGNGCAA